MKLILPLLAATGLGAVLTLAAAASVGPLAAGAFDHGDRNAVADGDRRAIFLASGDDDEGHDYRKPRRAGDDDEYSEDDDDDDGGAGATQNAAPAGTVAPPANGLFGNGPAPRVKVN